MRSFPLHKDGKEVIARAWIAESFFVRFLGLMGKKGIPTDEALVFPKCRSIHTFFMFFPIDVLFVSSDGRVVDALENLRPWRLPKPRFAASHVIEMAANRCRELGITKGTKLECDGLLR